MLDKNQLLKKILMI